MSKLNLMMPGHPRYQPDWLKYLFGYDNYAKWLISVEIAILEALCEVGFIPRERAILFTKRVKDRLLNGITTTEMDRQERGDKSAGIKGTNHDIEALKRTSEPLLPEKLWGDFHFAATSWDIIGTAISLIFKKAYWEVIRPQINAWGDALADRAECYANQVILGRTHGQPANPITVGHWLSYILGRLITIREHLDQFSSELVGKFSGPVGAGNALIAFGLDPPDDVQRRVMEKLNLAVPLISTQIPPPEPLSRYLRELGELSGVLDQFATDIRLLYIPEIGEVGVATLDFDPATTTGSSAMPHKRNPIGPENATGMHMIVSAMLTVLPSLSVSWLQRDLSGSCVMRFLPIIPICVSYTLNEMIKTTKRLDINAEKAQRNLDQQDDIILSELFQLALRRHGYTGNAHQLTNKLVETAKQNGHSLFETFSALATGEDDPSFTQTWSNIKNNQRLYIALRHPRLYTGNSTKNALTISARWRAAK